MPTHLPSKWRKTQKMTEFLSIGRLLLGVEELGVGQLGVEQPGYGRRRMPRILVSFRQKFRQKKANETSTLGSPGSIASVLVQSRYRRYHLLPPRARGAPRVEVQPLRARITGILRTRTDIRFAPA